MNVESWCQVEGRSNQKWTRTERKHNDYILKSSVFNVESDQDNSEGRTEWCTASKPKETELNRLAKRKHFTQKCNK